jgi:hypothetical protein
MTNYPRNPVSDGFSLTLAREKKLKARRKLLQRIRRQRRVALSKQRCLYQGESARNISKPRTTSIRPMGKPF